MSKRNERTNSKNSKGSSTKRNASKEYYSKGSNKDYSRTSKTEGSRGNDPLGAHNRVVSDINDPVWYGGGTQLGKDAASISFGNILGRGLPLTGSTDELTVDTPYVCPGVMTLVTHPTYGISRDQSSALNLAARQMYAFITKDKSGTMSYQPADLMMFLIAMDNAYSILAWMKRTYGIINTYSKVNAYQPEKIVEALGFNYSNLSNNLSGFRTLINQTAVKLQHYAVPKTMPIFRRHEWLFEGIYKDTNAEGKCQYYAFKPAGFYYFEEIVDGPGKMVFKSLNSTTQLSLANLTAFVNSFIDALPASESITKMRGDIINAYAGNLVEATGITEDFTVIPSYVEDISAQINNATIATINNDEITQDVTIGKGGPIIVNPKIADNPYTVTMDSWVLNLMTEDCGHERILEATRLMVPWKYDNEVGDAELITLGSEVIEAVQIWELNSDAPVTISHPFIYAAPSTGASNTNLRKLAALATFDNAPTLYYLDDINATFRPITDLRQFTWITPDELAKINDVALLYLFNVAG